VELSTDGKASCYGDVKLSSGYTADVKVELKQDGTTIKTWTKSGSGTISISGTYYVMTGHSYMVTTTATVYDSNGQVIETPTKNSTNASY
jgi:hypothetical protein